MQTIYKYKLHENDHGQLDVELPKGARVLSVQTQYNQPVFWAMVNTENEKEKRSFKIYPTGKPVDDNPGEYIGTFQMLGGALIFHLFETNGQESSNAA